MKKKVVFFYRGGRIRVLHVLPGTLGFMKDLLHDLGAKKYKVY
jgi:hypothetical protein